jgi:hypothetical protein
VLRFDESKRKMRNVMSGEYLDISSESAASRFEKAAAAGNRRFVGIHFRCCDLYVRIYINRDETAYAGNCPKCAKRVQLRIGPGGTDARFFTAG